MNRYEKRLRETFRLLKTESIEWKTCELVGYDEDDEGRDIPHFEACLGYAVVAPFSDGLSKENPTIQVHTADDGLAVGYLQNCQLCSHDISYPWRIKHNEKRWIMTVGSKCVEEYLNIDIDKMIQQLKLNQFLPSLRKWISDAGLEISTDPKFAKRKSNGEIKLYDNGRKHLVKSKYHEFRVKLYKLKINSEKLDELQFNEAKKLIRRGVTLGLTIPDNLLKAIESKKHEHSESRTGLDEFLRD